MAPKLDEVSILGDTFFLIDLEFMSKLVIITIFGYANEISLCHFHIVLC